MRREVTGHSPAADESGLERLVVSATNGDTSAVEELLRTVQGQVYNLAVRMLWCPEDAADATQEILMKVFTHLATFRRQSAFRTWVFRIATNHLLNIRKSRVEREEWTFSRFAADLVSGLSDTPAPVATEPDQALLLKELEIGCTQGMLLCLDRDQRVAYVLGDVFELSSEEAATVLDISAAAYRKRLSRARERLRSFMRSSCGLVSPDAACRCERRLPRAIELGNVKPGALLFASAAAATGGSPNVAQQVDEMEELHRIAAIYHSHPEYDAPERVLDAIRQTIDGDRFSLLHAT